MENKFSLEPYFDDIFEALYGSKVDEYGDTFRSVYCYECMEINNDFIDCIETMKKYYLPFFSVDETFSGNETIVPMIIHLEQHHIGNTLTINYDKLYSVSREILKDIIENCLS